MKQSILLDKFIICVYVFFILFVFVFMAYLDYREKNKRSNEVKFIMDNLPNDSLRREYVNTYMKSSEKYWQGKNYTE